MPFGVSVLAVLSIISGIIEILRGMVLAGVGGVGWFTGLLAFEETMRAWGGSRFSGGDLCGRDFAFSFCVLLIKTRSHGGRS